MIFDPLYFVFMLPGLAFMLWAQSKVKGNYKKYSQVRNTAGITGAQAARRVLDSQGLNDVQIEQIPGELSDHYDPRSRVLRLSQGVYGVPSIAAIGIAAHEAGHAIQHAKAYGPLKARTALVPAVNIGSNFGFIVLIAGLFMANPSIAWGGVALFGLSTLFALVTLPVEFDATKRAKAALVQVGLVDSGVRGGQESQGVAKVLDAAAWTYIAGFASSVLTLLYYVMLVSGMRRGD
ncbi:MAG: zinc metallopeptidase [Chloroflexia bacterium]|jgi:Zn-dependent membrane protease YugP|nr:zinc metallopeptidase [Chloroflexia bacterium]MDQ3524798.1 zinc metallopeptidase [Chloroflexota bacterium]